MMKVFLGLALFVWAFYSYADCQKVQTPINSKTKLYKVINKETPQLINTRMERAGNVEQVFISEKCNSTFTIRYQTAARNLKTSKISNNKYFCMAKLDNNHNDVLSAKCLVASKEPTSNSSSYDNDEPRAYPYGDIDDPFSGNGNNSGPRYGEEDPDYPSPRNNDGPDGYGDVLF